MTALSALNRDQNTITPNDIDALIPGTRGTTDGQAAQRTRPAADRGRTRADRPTHQPGRHVELHPRRGQQLVCDAFALGDVLRRRAASLTTQPADAENLVQDTLLKAFLSAETYVDGTNLRSWLFTIMRNTWIDDHRSARRRPTEEPSPDITILTEINHRRSHEQSAEARALAKLPGRAGAAITDLPPEMQQALFYSVVEGFSNIEIAKLLAIPVGTVGSRLHRGRSRLRELLAAR